MIVLGFLQGFLFIPECTEEMKPKIGMLFEEISSAEKFYK
jgi:hypothetical protein